MGVTKRGSAGRTRTWFSLFSSHSVIEDQSILIIIELRRLYNIGGLAMEFEEIMKMSEEEQMKMMEMNKRLCACVRCPTFIGTSETAIFFCGIGKSSIITEEKGCLCPDCPVTEKMGLLNMYYCKLGSEREIRG